MTRSMASLILMFGILSGSACYADEPIIGGPCERCKNVFVGLPETLTSGARIASVDEPGEPLVITGTVTTPTGDPAPRIIVYAYHTDAKGIYPRGTTRHGSLRAWVRTDKNGRYSFDTIRPASYPNTTIPQHVHMHVIEPGKATYYIDDVKFDDDPSLTERQRSNRRNRGGDGLSHPEKDADGVWHVRRDITLRLNVPE